MHNYFLFILISPFMDYDSYIRMLCHQKSIKIKFHHTILLLGKYAVLRQWVILSPLVFFSPFFLFLCYYNVNCTFISTTIVSNGS